MTAWPPLVSTSRAVIDDGRRDVSRPRVLADLPLRPRRPARLKRNIAILMVHDASGKSIYNAFAVSGEPPPWPNTRNQLGGEEASNPGTPMKQILMLSNDRDPDKQLKMTGAKTTANRRNAL